MLALLLTSALSVTGCDPVNTVAAHEFEGGEVIVEWRYRTDGHQEQLRLEMLPKDDAWDSNVPIAESTYEILRPIDVRIERPIDAENLAEMLDTFDTAGCCDFALPWRLDEEDEELLELRLRTPTQSCDIMVSPWIFELEARQCDLAVRRVSSRPRPYARRSRQPPPDYLAPFTGRTEPKELP